MLHQDSASRALLVGTACDPMNPALMLVALVLAWEGSATVAVVGAAPERLGLRMDVVLVTFEIAEPLEGRVAAAGVEAEVLVVAHFPGRSRLWIRCIDLLHELGNKNVQCCLTVNIPVMQSVLLA